MTITITINPTESQRVLDGFCSNQGYPATINGQPNPQSQQDFMTAALISYVKECVSSSETLVAINAAADTTQASVEKISIS